jgi:ABC-type branched-subunit amino acid transport system substrate-binding protein
MIPIQRRTLLAAGVATLGAPSFMVRAETGVSDTEIVLGHSGILQGPLGQPVKTVLGGANVALSELNAQGGVAGRKLRLVSLDDELKPDKAAANYQTLLTQHKVFAFFGCVGSGTTAAASKVLKESGAALVGGFAVADSAREKTRGSGYFLRASTAREAQVLVQHLTTIGITRIAMAHLDNPGGTEALSLIEAALNESKLKAVASIAVKGDASNAAAAAKHLMASEPQTIIMYLAGTLPGELMKAVLALGDSPSFYGMSIVDGGVTAKVLGERTRGLAISQAMPYPWGAIDPFVRGYRDLMTKANVPIGYQSLEGYFGAQVMIEALKRTGRDLTRPKLHATLKALKLRLAGIDIDFTGGQATGSRFVELVQVTRDGKYIR